MKTPGDYRRQRELEEKLRSSRHSTKNSYIQTALFLLLMVFLLALQPGMIVAYALKAAFFASMSCKAFWVLAVIFSVMVFLGLLIAFRDLSAAGRIYVAACLGLPVIQMFLYLAEDPGFLHDMYRLALNR